MVDNLAQFATGKTGALDVRNRPQCAFEIRKFVTKPRCQWVGVWQRLKNISHNTVHSQLIGWLELGTTIKTLAVFADNIAAKTMKGVDSDFIGVSPDDLAETLTHSGRSTFGKRQAQD